MAEISGLKKELFQERKKLENVDQFLSQARSITSKYNGANGKVVVDMEAVLREQSLHDVTKKQLEEERYFNTRLFSEYQYLFIEKQWNMNVVKMKNFKKD